MTSSTVPDRDVSATDLPHLLRLLPGPMLAVTLRGDVCGVNGPAADLLGRPEADLLGRNILSLVAEPARHTVRELLAPYLERLVDSPEDPEVRQASLPVTRGDGADFSADAYIKPVRTPDGLRLLVNFWDHDQHGRGTSLLSSTLKATDEGLVVLDFERRVRLVNDRYCELWGVDEIDVGTPLEDFFLGDILPQVRNPGLLLDAMVRPGEAGDVDREDLLYLTDGRVLRRHLRVRTAVGQPIGWVVAYRDVTREIEVRRGLSLSEARYRQLFHQNVAGVFRTRPDGTLLEVNRAFARTFGYETPDELMNMSAFEFYQDPEERRSYVNRVREEGAVRSHELHCRHRNGDDLFLLTNSAWVESEDGQDTLVGTIVDVTEERELKRELESMAYHDVLTGLPNRRLLRRRGTEAIEAACRLKERSVGLIYLDLTRFKQINDTFGHAIGDEALVQFARRVRGGIRDADTLARIGGDEFAVLLPSVEGPDAALGAAEAIAERLRAPFELEGRPVHIHARMGVALYPDTASSFDELLSHADHAMYRVEGWQRSEIELYLPDRSRAERADDLAREVALQEALDAGELSLYYQPIRDLREGRIAGAEALVRWERPGVGLVPAGDLLRLARRMGLERELEWWVVEAAIRRLGRWRKDDEGPGDLSVNLSARLFEHPDLLRRIRSFLESHDADGRDLTLEITEGAAMAAPEQAVETMQALRELGCTLAIDDFGTGYSAFAYLRQLPVDLLKLDRTFLDGITSERDAQKMARGMLAMGHGLGVRVLGEGVETREQLDWLEAAGFDYAQGYYLGRPRPDW